MLIVHKNTVVSLIISFWHLTLFFDLCKVIRKREDVYRVVKAFRDQGEWVTPEAQRFVDHLVLNG